MYVFWSCKNKEKINVHKKVNYIKIKNIQKLQCDVGRSCFQVYFVPKKNVTMETFNFNNLNEQEEHNIDNSLIDLKKQTAKCEFSCVCRRSFMNGIIKNKILKLRS